MIQDRTSRILIEAGEKWDRVYVLITTRYARACRANGLEDRELWHRRLGHPSQKHLSFITSIRCSIGTHDSSEHCDTCLRAKQTR